MLIIRVSFNIVSGLEPCLCQYFGDTGGIKETRSADGRPRASLSIVSIVTPAGADIDLMLPHKTETVARPGTVN